MIELRRITAPVGYKPQGVGPDPIEELDEGKGEVEEEEAEQVPRVWVGQDEADPVALHHQLKRRHKYDQIKGTRTVNKSHCL